MSSLIVLNSTHIVNNGYNNTLRYTFGNSAVNFSNMEIAVAGIQLYNSQFNINSTLYGNNTFQIIVPYGATTSTISITLPNGYYSYADIQNYVASKLIAAGAYLIDSNGNNVIYFNISENSTYYGCQIDLLPTPLSLPTGWSLPASGLYSTGVPTGGYAPQIIIPSGFNLIVGYQVATFPPSRQTTAQSFLSSFTPQVNPVSSFLVRCNLVNNPYTSVPDVLTTFTSQNTTIGDLIDVRYPEYSWVEISDGSRPYIEVIICDQNYNIVKFEDSQILIQLIIRPKKN